MPRKKKVINPDPKLFKNNPLTDELAREVGKKWLTNKFVLLTPSTGIGKTFVTIHAVGLLPGGDNAHLMVYCPLAKKEDRSWVNSVEGYNITQSKHMTVSVNTHAYLRDHEDDILAEIKTHRESGHAIILVVDEAHLAKNPTSKLGKKLAKFVNNPDIAAAIGISATPYSNSYIDTIGYLVYNGYYKNKTDFIKNQIKQFDDYHQPAVKNLDGEIDRNLFKDPDYIDQALANFSVDKKLEKSPLPPASFEERTFELNDDKKIKYVDPAFADFINTKKRTQRGNYNAVKNKYYREGYYESAVEAVAVQRTMITAISQRVNILIDILKEIREGQDPHPVLIFYQNNIELETITRVLEQTNRLTPTHIHVVNGRQKDLEDVTDPSTVVLIQYKAGSAAIEFPHAYSSIYFMPTYSYETYQQTLGRNRRNGMTHPVKYYKIIALNTLDDYVWHEIIQNKKVFSQKTMHSVMQRQAKKS